MSTSALRDTHRAVKELTEARMDESAAEAVVALVRESITEGCASRSDLTAAKDELTAAMAAQKDEITAAMSVQKDEITAAMAAQKDELTAAMAARKVVVDKRFDGIDERLAGMDQRIIVLEERSRTWVTKHELAAALKEERRYTDAQFERVWGEIKDVGKSVTTLHEKMFGRTANSIRIAAALAAMLFIALQVYDMFFRV